MQAIMTKIGNGNALRIVFENREEFDGFIDLARPSREDSIELAKERSKTSDIDELIKLLEKTYREEPSYKNPDITSCSCIIFNSDIPDLFWALFNCMGLYYGLSPLKKLILNND